MGILAPVTSLLFVLLQDFFHLFLTFSPPGVSLSYQNWIFHPRWMFQAAPGSRKGAGNVLHNPTLPSPLTQGVFWDISMGLLEPGWLLGALEKQEIRDSIPDFGAPADPGVRKGQ